MIFPFPQIKTMRFKRMHGFLLNESELSVVELSLMFRYIEHKPRKKQIFNQKNQELDLVFFMLHLTFSLPDRPLVQSQLK